MNKYETLFLIKPDLPEDQVQAVLDRLSRQIEVGGGKVAAIDHWGLRRLAYPVSYRGEQLRRGYYVLLTYLGKGETVDELERNLKILDHTFRYLSVKLDEGVDPAAITEVVVTRKTPPSHADAPPPAPPPPAETAASPESAAAAEPPAAEPPVVEPPAAADQPAVEESSPDAGPAPAAEPAAAPETKDEE